MINYYGACPKDSKYAVYRFGLNNQKIPTDSREFNTFEEADKAAKWFADNYKNGKYINMR